MTTSFIFIMATFIKYQIKIQSTSVQFSTFLEPYKHFIHSFVCILTDEGHWSEQDVSHLIFVISANPDLYINMFCLIHLDCTTHQTAVVASWHEARVWSLVLAFAVEQYSSHNPLLIPAPCQ